MQQYANLRDITTLNLLNYIQERGGELSTYIPIYPNFPLRLFQSVLSAEDWLEKLKSLGQEENIYLLQHIIHESNFDFAPMSCRTLFMRLVNDGNYGMAIYLISYEPIFRHITDQDINFALINGAEKEAFEFVARFVSIDAIALRLPDRIWQRLVSTAYRYGIFDYIHILIERGIKYISREDILKFFYILLDQEETETVRRLLSTAPIVDELTSEIIGYILRYAFMLESISMVRYIILHLGHKISGKDLGQSIISSIRLGYLSIIEYIFMHEEMISLIDIDSLQKIFLQSIKEGYVGIVRFMLNHETIEKRLTRQTIDKSFITSARAGHLEILPLLEAYVRK